MMTGQKGALKWARLHVHEFLKTIPISSQNSCILRQHGASYGATAKVCYKNYVLDNHMTIARSYVMYTCVYVYDVFHLRRLVT